MTCRSSVVSLRVDAGISLATLVVDRFRYLLEDSQNRNDSLIYETEDSQNRNDSLIYETEDSQNRNDSVY